MAYANNFTVNQFLSDPINNSDSCFNFFDWFCRDKSLKNRMLKLKSKLAFLVKCKIIDGDKTYVLFKNNCPCDGDLYDDLRIIDIESDEMICGLAPSVGYTNKKGACEFWSYNDTGVLIEQSFDSYKLFQVKALAGEIKC